MSLIGIFRDTIPRQLQKLSKIESMILGALMTMESGNAYSLWKETKLKYYPTVLRALKKLEEKNLVKIISKGGSRGETVYAPTLTGIFVFYILKEESQKLLNFVSKNSTLFRELYTMQKDIRWMYSIIREFFWSEKREQLSIDEMVKSVLETSIMDALDNIRYDPKARKKLMEFSKISGVKPLIIEMIETEIERNKKDLKALNEFQRVMETT